jgi:hypothetical protein
LSLEWLSWEVALKRVIYRNINDINVPSSESELDSATFFVGIGFFGGNATFFAGGSKTSHLKE